MTAQSIRRRWFQWRLRTLLAIVTACAAATAWFIAPRVREQAVITWLRDKDAQITLEAEGPEWLRHLIGDKYLQRVVGVKIVEKPIAGSDLSRFDGLMRLRTLRFMDSVLDDFYRGHFVGEEIPPALSSLSIADVEQFADKRREVDCDVAFAESLYRYSAAEYDTDYVLLRDVLFACQTAAKWKLACAECNGDATAPIAAREQLVGWLQEITSRADAKVAAHAKGVRLGEAALARCALWNAKLALNRARESRSGEQAASSEGSAVAAELVRITDPAPGDGPIDPYQVDLAWSCAFDLLLAATRRKSGDEAELVVLKQQADAFSHLAARIGNLYDAGERGGETEKFELARTNLALAEARLARTRGDEDAERRILKDALPRAKHMREAIKAAYEVGVSTVTDMLYSDGRATELETAFAEAVHDVDMKRAVAEARLEFIEQVWQKRAALRYTAVRGDGYEGHDEWAGCLFRCLLAVHRIERVGCAAFSDTVASFAPRDETFELASDGGEMSELGPADELLPDAEVAPPAPDDMDALPELDCP